MATKSVKNNTQHTAFTVRVAVQVIGNVPSSQQSALTSQSTPTTAKSFERTAASMRYVRQRAIDQEWILKTKTRRWHKAQRRV
jgi:hypothetical protein